MTEKKIKYCANNLTADSTRHLIDFLSTYELYYIIQLFFLQEI